MYGSENVPGMVSFPTAWLHTPHLPLEASVPPGGDPHRAFSPPPLPSQKTHISREEGESFSTPSHEGCSTLLGG